MPHRLLVSRLEMPFFFLSSNLRKSRSGASPPRRCLQELLLRPPKHHRPLIGCYRFKTALSHSKRRPTKAKQLSRKERRLMERKEENAKRRKEIQQGKAPITSKVNGATPSSGVVEQLRRFLPARPCMPGGFSSFGRDQWIAAAKRIPFVIVLVVLVLSEDTSPLVFVQTKGASMLPTIHPIGDIFLSSTGAWSRLLQLKRSYKVGDIVLWRDPETGESKCKRVVGVEGDTVRRYGEYADNYTDWDDWGIVPVPQCDDSWDTGERLADKMLEVQRPYVVPSGHVWLEGDFPPFSLDCRHRGPVPVDWIHGKLICRLWPPRRSKGVPDIAVSSGQRPTPLSLDEALMGSYNLSPRPR